MMTNDDDFAGDDAAVTDDRRQRDADGEEEEEEILLTKEGMRKLKEELEELRTVRRREIAERLKEAISYGDLSENAEYEEAKNEQAVMEGRIRDLEQTIRRARIISEKHAKGGATVVGIGSMVTVEERGGRDGPETYTIVGSTEADPVGHRISNESPIGKALIGRQRGDVVEVQAPGGRFRYEILKVA